MTLNYESLFRLREIPYPIRTNPKNKKSITSKALRKDIATPTAANIEIINIASRSIGTFILFMLYVTSTCLSI